MTSDGRENKTELFQQQQDSGDAGSAMAFMPAEIDAAHEIEIRHIKENLGDALEGTTDMEYAEQVLDAANKAALINAEREQQGLPLLSSSLWVSTTGTEQHEIDQPTLGQELADDLAADGIPECSIAASDIARISFIRMSGISPLDKSMQLSNIEEGGSPEKVHMEWLNGGKVVLASGHTARLGFAIDKKRNTNMFVSKKDREPKNLRLVAVVRDDIVFPLVRFNRTDKDYCDYLQFWGEEEMDELESVNFYGWGSDDNGSRFDAVQSVGSLISYNPRGKDEAVTQVVDALKLSERVEKVLGTSSKLEEDVLRFIFSDPVGEQEEYTKEFSQVAVGKVTTDITARGVLQNIEGDDNRMQLVVQSFPSSQPERKWRAQTAIIDKRTGIIMVDSDGNATEPNTTQVQLIRDLVSQRVNYPDRYGVTKARSILPDRLASYSIIFTTATIGQVATKALLDFGNPINEAAPNAGIVTCLAVGLNKIWIHSAEERKARKRSRIRGGDEEEV